jgi:hypothetical protein
MIVRPLFALALLAVSTSSIAAKVEAEPTECESNFTYGGSFSSGKTFKTSQQYTGIPYNTVFDKVADAITADGLSIIDQSKERGYIRANNPVKGGDGGTAVAPLRVLVLGKPDGSVKVDATFSIAGGQMTTKKAIMTHLCQMLAAPLS